VAHFAPFLLVGLLVSTGDELKKRRASFTVSKETTHVTGPVGKDGYIDYPAALNERLGKGVTPNSNANVLIWQALGPTPQGSRRMPAEFFKLMGMDEPPEAGDYFVDMTQFTRNQLQLNDPDERFEIEQQSRAAGRRPLAAHDYPHVADWLKANTEPLDLVADAVKRPRYFNPHVPARREKGSAGLMSVAQPGVQSCRYVADALVARAMHRLHAGQTDAAWQDLLACIRLGRHVGRGATLIEALVGIAIGERAHRAALVFLERPELKAKDFRGFLADLRAAPPMPDLGHHLDTAERFIFIEWVMTADREGVEKLVEGLEMVDGLVKAVTDKEPAGRLFPEVPVPAGPQAINWDPALRAGNQLFDRLVAAARETDRPKREDQFDRIEKEIKDVRRKLAGSKEVEGAVRGTDVTPEARGRVFGDLLLILMVPAARKMQASFDRNEQTGRNLHVAFALAAYRRDHGAYPKSLDALAPKYLPKVPDDLFTGKPLVYRPVEAGYLLYSFGPNGKDDGGRWFNDDPRGDDPGVRIPLPEPKK
jgi:hypothetical protein